MAWYQLEYYIKGMMEALGRILVRLVVDILELPKCFTMQLIGHIGTSLCVLLGATQAVTLRNAEDGFMALQQWYNESTGLWIPSSGWWNSANCELCCSIQLVDTHLLCC
jgi:hypothetical protein